MFTKFGSLVVVAIVSAALVAGCGSDDKKSSTPASTASTPSVTATSAPPATEPATTTKKSSTPSAADPAIKAAITACKSSVDAAPTLPAASKTKLEGLCEKAANGDASGVQKVVAQVCQEVAKSLPDAARSAAEASCPKA